MTAKAPKGGIASEVNGQFYEGGEFIPDTGLYCGRGKNRISLAKFSEVAEKAKKANFILRYSEARECFEFSRVVKFANGETSEQVMMTARTLATLARLV